MDHRVIADRIAHDRGITVQKWLGKGAFKQVFLGVMDAGDQVAIKVLQGNTRLARLEREIAAMQSCDHPNIGKVREAGVISVAGADYPFVIEECLLGGTLEQRVQHGKLLPEEQAADILLELIEAIGHLNELQLVHRDIKPANILFRDAANSPVLCDFGLVRNLAEDSLTNTWVTQGPGTPFFAAPEQLLNKKDLIDWRTDQFGLGVTMCVVTFGRHPYQMSEGESLWDVVDRVSRRDYSAGWLDQLKSPFARTLSKMVEPWSMNRFRKPETLRLAMG